MSTDNELKAWSIEIHFEPGKAMPPQGVAPRHESVLIGAFSLMEAIEAALNEFDPNEEPWAASAEYKGPIQKIVGYEQDDEATEEGENYDW